MKNKDNTEPMEARIGGGGDKCTHRLDIPVSERTHDAIAALAGMSGDTKAEYVRKVLEQHAFGMMDYTRSRMGQ
jgi:hypothetical protein